MPATPKEYLLDFLNNDRLLFLHHKPNSKEWELERNNGIGGSNLSDLLESNQYACKRRLAYEKLGTSPDYARRSTYALSRGHRQEPVARDYYTEKTNRQVTHGFGGALLKARPYIRVNVDGVYQEASEFGVLEIKTLGKDSYAEKKKNLPEEYTAQAQYAAGILNLPLTSIALFCPDQDALTVIDAPADPVIYNGLERMVISFWEQYIEKKILPEKLEYGSPVCKTCVFRKACKGMNSRGASGLDF